MSAVARGGVVLMVVHDMNVYSYQPTVEHEVFAYKWPEHNSNGLYGGCCQDWCM